MDVPDFVDVKQAEAFGRKMDKTTYWTVFQRRFTWMNKADDPAHGGERAVLMQRAMRDLACCRAFEDREFARNTVRKEHHQ